MLGATVLLYMTARRLFTPTVGVIAAALWVTCEPALKLGAFATYDPMAVFLICLAAWLAVYAAQSRRHGELVALTAIVLATGSIIAYSYAIYIPAVVAVALLAWIPQRGRRKAVISAAWLTGATGFLLLLIPTELHLWPGIQFTVLDRAHGTNSISLVFRLSWSYIGLTISLALAAVLLAIIRGETKRTIALLAVLFGASLLVPLQQARINAATNIDKHLACGAWFAAIAGAWGIATVVRVSWPKRYILGATACAAALAVPADSGWSQANANFKSWSTATSLAAAVKAVTPANGPILAFDAPVAEYYSGPLATDWQRWTNLNTNKVVGQNDSADQLAIPHLVTTGYYSEIILTFALQTGSLPIIQALPSHNKPLDQDQDFVRTLVQNYPIEYATLLAVEGNPAYRIAATGSYNASYKPGAYVIWLRSGQTG
jgi:4-amino-4-deoxy-L-arabinose transferase-like glycosyltransferase